MRRSEREIRSRPEIDEIIRGSQVCRLGLALDGRPYVVPVSFGYDGSAIAHRSGVRQAPWRELHRESEDHVPLGPDLRVHALGVLART
ncbi:MAG: pyridoxamine 5'-phosphate oxidase family protein [Candidatus Eisenbacteria bacterium]